MRNGLLAPPQFFERSVTRSKTGAEGSPARRLFDTAVTLCATEGFGVTVRDIAATAKTNVAAINYYYESKDNLMQLVVEASMEPINEMILSYLTAYEDFVGGGKLDPSHIWNALAAPLIRCSIDETSWYAPRARVYVRAALLANSSIVRSSYAAQAELITKRFTKALTRALPGLSQEDIRWRFYFAWGTILTATRDSYDGAHFRRVSKGSSNAGNLDELLKQVVIFLTKATSK
jgi:AcrR family transcriptional regulator